MSVYISQLMCYYIVYSNYQDLLSRGLHLTNKLSFWFYFSMLFLGEGGLLLERVGEWAIFLAISWRDQVTFRRDDTCIVLSQHTRYTLAHYPDFGSTRLCSYSLTLRGERRSSKYQFNSFLKMTLPGLEPSICFTRGEYASQHTTDAVTN